MYPYRFDVYHEHVREMLVEQLPRRELFPAHNDSSSLAVSPYPTEHSGAHEVDLWEARAEKCVRVLDALQDRVVSLATRLRDKDLLNKVIFQGRAEARSRQAELQKELRAAREKLVKKKKMIEEKMRNDKNEIRKLPTSSFTPWMAVVVLCVTLGLAELVPANIAQRVVDLTSALDDGSIGKMRADNKPRTVSGVKATSDNGSKKRLVLLEDRVEQTLVKFNESLVANKQLREEIEHLRKQCMQFDSIQINLKLENLLKQKRADAKMHADYKPAAVGGLTVASDNHSITLDTSNIVDKCHESTVRRVEDERRMATLALKHVSSLERPAETVHTDFRAQDVAKTLPAFAFLGVTQPSEVFIALRGRAVQVARDFTARDVARVLRAFTKLRACCSVEPGDELLNALKRRARKLVGSYSSEEVETTLRYLKLFKEIYRQKKEMKPLRALIHMSSSWKVLFDQTRRTGTTNQETFEQPVTAFEASEVASELRHIAELGMEASPELLHAMEVCFIEVYEHFTSQEVAATLAAFAKLDATPGVELLSALKGRALSVIGVFTAEDVSNTLWALAVFQEAPGLELLNGLRWRAEMEIKDFSDKDASKMMWAFSALGEAPGHELLQAFQPSPL